MNKESILLKKNWRRLELNWGWCCWIKENQDLEKWKSKTQKKI